MTKVSAAPEVSVIIPTRDRWELLSFALGSALAQEDVACEIIVVDDGSVSPMPESLPGLSNPRVRVERCETRGGPARARNTGIRRARGRWVAFLDDDDIWAPDKLRRQLDATDTSVGFAYSSAILTDARRKPIALDRAPAAHELSARLRSLNCIPAACSNVIVRAEVLRGLGGFDELLWQLADWDLCIRLAARARPAVDPRQSVAYMQHAENLRVTKPGLVMRELRYLDRKHQIHDPRAERRWLLRWAAEGERQRGRRLLPAAIYVRSWAKHGSRPDLLRAIGVLGGESLLAAWRALERRAGGEQVAASPHAAPSPEWLQAAQMTGSLSSGTEPDANGASPILAGRGDQIGSPDPWRRLVDAALRARAGLLLTRVRLSGEAAGLAIVYHRVAAESGDPARDLVPAVACRDLEAQLQHLGSRYRPVRASELVSACRGRRRGRRVPVALTFDDDLLSHLTRAAPVLREHRMPATFFLTGAALDSGGAFWWQRLQAAFDSGTPLPPALARVSEEPLEARGDASAGAPSVHAVAEVIRRLSPADRAKLAEKLPEPDEAELLDRDGVANLAQAGFDVGFHTLGHDSLPALPDEALERALVAGRATLESVVGRQLDAIAYPHGRGDERVASLAEVTGYTSGFTTTAERVTESTHPLLVGRLEAPRFSDGRFALTIARLVTGVSVPSRRLASIRRRLAASERRLN